MTDPAVFYLPDPGEGLTEAVLGRWLVAAGDTVHVNQAVAEIETAKSMVELPCPYDGVVAQLMAGEGETVAVGAPLLSVEWSVPPPGSGSPDDGPADSRVPVLVGYGVAPDPVPLASRPVLAKPPVRQLAREVGVDLATVRATGPGGIVTREDILAAQEQQAPQKLATYPGDDQPWLVGGTVSHDGRHTRVPIQSVRKRTAEAMVTSAFTAPHVSVFHTLDVTKTMKLVKALRRDPDFADIHVTPLLIAAKAVLLAVQRHPEINASWDEAAREIVYKHYVNLGIAAATPRGLIVPNIKDAHRMRLHELGYALGELTRRARAGRAQLADLSDGTITITNVGVFGIDTGTPILNPGEAAILALGAITEQPWVHKGHLRKRWVTQLALSFDHRLVDGGLGSVVLADVARVLTDPAQALVWG